VDTSFFTPSAAPGEFFLIVSAFVPYKRIDLAIEAFNRSGDRLVIIGDGPEGARLRARAGRTIEFHGWQPDEKLKEYYARCTALIFPGEEDFGIVPLEAMAAGKPVIAYAKGGALETVLDSPELRTGILFPHQTIESLLEAIQRCKQTSFSAEQLRAHALAFDRTIYKRKMFDFIMHAWDQFAAHRRAEHG
jgi:glycosyltransferase involved in cell wall biosynthesis